MESRWEVEAGWRAGGPALNHANVIADDDALMFTIYGIYPEGHEDGHTDVPTLDEALKHLRELIDNEQADEDGPVFARYGLAFDQTDAKGVVRQLRALAG